MRTMLDLAQQKHLTARMRVLEKQLRATRRADYCGCSGFASDEARRQQDIDAVQEEYLRVCAERMARFGF